jgi:hypothetical protein
MYEARLCKKLSGAGANETGHVGNQGFSGRVRSASDPGERSLPAAEWDRPV